MQDYRIKITIYKNCVVASGQGGGVEGQMATWLCHFEITTSIIVLYTELDS